jgi:hypothetical protein
VLKNLIHLEQRSSMGPCREKDRRRGHLLDNTKLLKVAKTFFTIWSLPSFQADQSFQRACKLDYPEMEFLVEFYALCYSQSFLTYSTYFVFKNLYKKISEPRLIKSLHENYFVE